MDPSTVELIVQMHKSVEEQLRIEEISPPVRSRCVGGFVRVRRPSPKASDGRGRMLLFFFFHFFIFDMVGWFWSIFGRGR